MCLIHGLYDVYLGFRLRSHWIAIYYLGVIQQEDGNDNIYGVVFIDIICAESNAMTAYTSGYISVLLSSGISLLTLARRSRSMSATAICGSWYSSPSLATTSPHGLTIMECP